MKTISSIHRGPGVTVRFIQTFLVVCILFLSLAGHAQSQSGYSIQGRVILEEDNTSLAGVNIYLKNTSIGVATDSNGQFTFPRLLNTGDVIVFSFLGLEKVEYKVPASNPGFVEIRMHYESILIRGALVSEPRSETKRRKMKSTY